MKPDLNPDKLHITLSEQQSLPSIESKDVARDQATYKGTYIDDNRSISFSVPASHHKNLTPIPPGFDSSSLSEGVDQTTSASISAIWPLGNSIIKRQFSLALNGFSHSINAPSELTFLASPSKEPWEVMILTGQSALVLDLALLSSMMPPGFWQSRNNSA
jgi:hypothetical protein